MAAASRKATRKPSKAKTSKAKTGKANAKAKTLAGAKAKAVKPKAKTAKPKTKTGKPKAASPRKSAARKTPPSNRRRFDRRDTRIAAKLEHAGGVTEGTVTNLSLEGCLFAPRIALKPDSRIKLYLANETKPVAATVKAVSDLGVHCLMHAGGVTLGRLSTDLDDMALLMLSAGRPHVVTSKPEAKRK
jgi:hypothetical protein